MSPASRLPVLEAEDISEFRVTGAWVGLSTTAALVGATASAIALLNPRLVYGQETAFLADQAAAQDLTNLLLVSPLLVALGFFASRGSARATTCWLGCLAFTTYNYAIYAFSIHFGPLFLPWVAVLGLSGYALIGGAANWGSAAGKRTPVERISLTGWFLIVVASLFTLLWLREIVPDLVAGNPSSSALEWKVPTNPVHVLDLAIYLPAVLGSGVLVLRRHRLGYASAPGALVFVALTCVPIVLTPLVADSRGNAAGWAVVPPIGLLLVATTLVLLRTLVGLRLASEGTRSLPRNAG